MQIRAVFAEYTPLIEPLALDEAYLDVTENFKGLSSATQIAEDIRAKIRKATGLTASAGVSYNKFLAKIASDYRKPDGLFVITPKMGPAFVETLEVGRFHGVGPATRERMNRLGIETGADLKAQSLAFLEQHFGKAGAYYYWIARGVDERPVRANRIRKSIGAENTFFQDVFTLPQARDALAPIVDKVWGACEKNNMRGRTATLKVKYADFRIITRSRTIDAPIGSREELAQIALELVAPGVSGAHWRSPARREPVVAGERGRRAAAAQTRSDFMKGGDAQSAAAGNVSPRTRLRARSEKWSCDWR